MVIVLRVPSLSGFHWELGLTVMEKKIVVVVKYVQVIGSIVGSCWFPSGLSSFLYRCIDFEVVRGS